MTLAERVAALSEGELETLRLFLKHSDQKALARALNKSPYTIEKRLSAARRKLGVSRSIDAAHLLSHHETGGYGSPVYPLSAIDAGPLDGVPDGPPEEAGASPFLPFPTRGRPWNVLPPWVRLLWIVFGVFALTIAAIAVLAMAETISRLIG